MAEEIKQRISIDNAEQVEQQLRNISEAELNLAKASEKVGDAAATAAPKVDRQNEATKDLGDNAKRASEDSTKLAQETHKAGDAAEASSGKLDRAAKSQDSLSGAIGGSMRSWASWTVVVSAAVAVVTDITRTASQAAEAVKSLGNELKTLAVNQGGKAADETIKDINAIARTQSLSVSERNELIGAAGTLTDLNPNTPQTALREQLTNIARLRKVAGNAAGSGSDAASLLVTAQAKTGFSSGEAADQLGALMTSGFDQKTLGDLYRRGDQDLIAAVYGARGKGLDLGRAASSLPQIMGALDRRDAQGKLTPDLMAAGVNDDMNTVQRLQAVQKASQAGLITPAQKLSLLGGYEAQDVTGPLLQASSPQAIAAAKAEIQATTLTGLEGRRGSSRYVQAADRAAQRELVDQVTLEESYLAPAGEFIEDFKAGLRRRGGGSAVSGAAVWNTPWDVISRPHHSQNVTNIAQQFIMGSDGKSPLRRASEGGLK